MKQKKPEEAMAGARRRGCPPVMALLCCFVACAFLQLGCVDTFDRTPPPVVVVNHPPNPTSDRFGPIYGTIDGLTSASLVIDSGFVSATSCTLYIYLKYCNGLIPIRLGENPTIFTSNDRLTRLPFCSDTNQIGNWLEYIYTGLKPKTKYYLAIKGYWSIADAWVLQYSFTTRADSSADTSNPVP
jgi:hypothetical protein